MGIKAMSEPRYLMGDPYALDEETDEQQEKDDFWNAVDDAYDAAMDK